MHDKFAVTDSPEAPLVIATPMKVSSFSISSRRLFSETWMTLHLLSAFFAALMKFQMLCLELPNCILCSLIRVCFCNELCLIVLTFRTMCNHDLWYSVSNGICCWSNDLQVVPCSLDVILNEAWFALFQYIEKPKPPQTNWLWKSNPPQTLPGNLKMICIDQSITIQPLIARCRNPAFSLSQGCFCNQSLIAKCYVCVDPLFIFYFYVVIYTWKFVDLVFQ